MEKLGITHLQDKLITSISDGERQKAFVAKTLAQQTPILLLDEPTAFLDYRSKKEFFSLMKQEAIHAKKILLISSHDIDFLIRHTDYLILIEDGGNVAFDTTEKIIQSPYFETHFTY